VRRRNLLCAGAGVWVASGARAEETTVTDELERRVRATLADWDRLPEHRTGSAGDHETAQWLLRQIDANGATARLEAFPFERRNFGSCWIDLDGHRIEGVPCFDGGRTGKTPLTAELGRDDGIAVVTFQPSGSPELSAARRDGRHAAVVAISAGDPIRPGLAPLNADDYEVPWGPPVLQIASEHRARMASAAARHARAALLIDAAIERTTAFNVGAEIPGTRPDLAPLVVMTPRSGWWRCTSERGGGIVAFLECVRHFARHRPERTVLFTANTGHELGHLGLDAFVASSPGRFADAHAWLHLGANFAARGGRVRVQASDPSWLDALRSELASRSVACDATPVGTRPFGEARNVFDAGGRYVSILGTNPRFHHPDDRWPDAVDVDVTVAATIALVATADRLARA